MLNFKNFLKYLFVILFSILIDQISKSFLIIYLKTKYGMTIELTPWLDIVYAWNYGISFGLFSQYFQYSNYVFVIINCLIVSYLVTILKSSSNRIQSFGLSFIIGGAIGNLIDRLARGAVFDFIYLHNEKYSFPAFNFADSFINIGVFFVILSMIKSRKIK